MVRVVGMSQSYDVVLWPLAIGLTYPKYSQCFVCLLFGCSFFNLLSGVRPVADPENFGGGGFEAQNLKNSDVFTKIQSDFSAEVGNSTVIFAQIQVVSKKINK